MDEQRRTSGSLFVSIRREGVNQKEQFILQQYAAGE